MTLYLVRHGSGDVRLHDDAGTELFTLSSNPMDSDGPERDLVEAFETANPGVDFLGNDDVRPHFVDLITNNWNYLDLTAKGQTTPW